MWLEILGLSVIIAIFVFLVIFRKNPYVKAYWKISLVLLPFAIFLVLKIIVDLRRPRPSTGSGPVPSGGLEGKIEEIKEQITDIHIEKTAEIAVAKTKNEELVKKLEEVKKISDRTERRRRLIGIIG